ncbi:MAG TPA: permease, partial [bacterium]|nr:permease [bacterium]
AAHLKKQGASTSATLAFLVSTPTTGIDSILATYALLGPIFALTRPAAAFLAGILSGLLALKSPATSPVKAEASPAAPGETASSATWHKQPFLTRLVSALRYGFLELVAEVGRWVLAGLIIGSLIDALIPESVISRSLAHPWLAYPAMLAAGIPMYVCATGSIPVAASLVSKGMLPGAAMVFLFAGPATNAATVAFVGKKLGFRALVSYLGSIILVALFSGLAIDRLYSSLGSGSFLFVHGQHHLPEGLRMGSGVFLLGLLLYSYFRRPATRKATGLTFSVPDISCQHCARTIQTALSSVPGVTAVQVKVKEKSVTVEGTASEAEIVAALTEAGYPPEKK